MKKIKDINITTRSEEDETVYVIEVGNERVETVVPTLIGDNASSAEHKRFDMFVKLVISMVDETTTKESLLSGINHALNETKEGEIFATYNADEFEKEARK